MMLFFIYLIPLERKNLKRWNLAQAKIWRQLVKTGIVESNNLEDFTIFAKYFHLHAEKTKRAPGMKYLKINIDKHKRKDK